MDIAVIGGDRRIACMVPIFQEKGYQVISYGTWDWEENKEQEKGLLYARSLKEAVASAEVIVGGIPFEADGRIASGKELPDMRLTELERCLRKKQKVFGGVLPESLISRCEKREIGCYDFMKEESLSIFNAIATAEGTILEAMKNKGTNIHKSKSLVLGYGRCGKVLADKLKGLSASVTVLSRNPKERAYAGALGLDAIGPGELKQEIHAFEYIYNTIPAMVVTKELLAHTRKDVLIIDIASKRGGTDFTAADLMGRRALHCLGLPGKYAGISSAGSMVEYVIQKAF